MGLGDLFKSVFGVSNSVFGCKPLNPLKLSEPSYYQSIEYDVKPNFIYLSQQEQNAIDMQFKDLDGYFTKLISKDNELLGYVFRCTHRNVIIEKKDGTTLKYPYFVTCYYQRVIPDMLLEVTKSIGKARAIKTGLRVVKALAKYANNDEVFNEDMHYFDFDSAINLHTFIFDVEEEDKVNAIIDYVKNFNDKIYKYYHEIDHDNIKVIWLSSLKNYEI